MSAEQLHKTQVSILHSLRYAETERFSELMQPTGQTSDTFKFHLRKLFKLGYVTKTKGGTYQLTPHGKEYANNLNEHLRAPEKQPKISVLLVIPKQDADGNTRYLLQKRKRNPFYEFWNEIHGRTKWGESFEETAKRELKKQTDLDADFTVHSFRRVRDYDANDKALLEDKLFVIVVAHTISGDLSNSYKGGENAWLSLDELRGKEKVFESTIDILENLSRNVPYKTHDFMYTPKEY